MPFSLADLAYGGLVPAVIAAALWWLLPRACRRESLQPLCRAVALVAGVQAGYWLLGLGRPAPVLHWEWLPWTLLLSVAGAVPLPQGTGGRILKCVLLLIVASAASWLLVPDWEHLQPSRGMLLIVLTAGIVLIGAGVEALSRRLPAAELCLMLSVVLVGAAVILALAGSLRFAQIVGCGSAALIGMSAAATLGRRDRTAEGVALPFAVLAAGMMLIGRVDSFSEVPLLSYILPPLAPLTLGPLVAGRPARSATPRRGRLFCIPVLVCVIAVALAALAEGA